MSSYSSEKYGSAPTVLLPRKIGPYTYTWSSDAVFLQNSVSVDMSWMKQDVKMLIMMVYDGDNTKTRYGHLAEWELI